MFPICDAPARRFGSPASALTSPVVTSWRSTVRQAQKMQAVGQLAGGVAHDFNNMLAAIMSAADELANGVDAPAQQRFVRADPAGQRARGRADAQPAIVFTDGKGPQRARRCPPGRFVTWSRCCSGASTGASPFESSSWRTHPLSNGDAAQLQSALLNLGINARDAMPNGGQLQISTHDKHLDSEACGEYRSKVSPGRYLEIEVRDTGSGISAASASSYLRAVLHDKGRWKGYGDGARGGLRCGRGASRRARRPIAARLRDTFQVYLPVLEAPR